MPRTFQKITSLGGNHSPLALPKPAFPQVLRDIPVPALSAQDSSRAQAASTWAAGEATPQMKASSQAPRPRAPQQEKWRRDGEQRADSRQGSHRPTQLRIMGRALLRTEARERPAQRPSCLLHGTSIFQGSKFMITASESGSRIFQNQ